MTRSLVLVVLLSTRLLTIYAQTSTVDKVHVRVVFIATGDGYPIALNAGDGNLLRILGIRTGSIVQIKNTSQMIV